MYAIRMHRNRFKVHWRKQKTEGSKSWQTRILFHCLKLTMTVGSMKSSIEWIFFFCGWKIIRRELICYEIHIIWKSFVVMEGLRKIFFTFEICIEKERHIEIWNWSNVVLAVTTVSNSQVSLIRTSLIPFSSSYRHSNQHLLQLITWWVQKSWYLGLSHSGDPFGQMIIHFRILSILAHLSVVARNQIFQIHRFNEMYRHLEDCEYSARYSVQKVMINPLGTQISKWWNKIHISPNLSPIPFQIYWTLTRVTIALLKISKLFDLSYVSWKKKKTLNLVHDTCSYIVCHEIWVDVHSPSTQEANHES